MAEYRTSNQHFINPYNFVPVDLKKTERSVLPTKDLITGYIQCYLKCRTPLAIPDVANKRPTDVKDHFAYPFMGMEMKQKQPLIPGSSLRGVIRNVYEALTDSCFGTMQKDTFITARSNRAFNPGLLIKEGNEWKLYQAKRHLIVVDRTFWEDKNLKEQGIRHYAYEDWKGQSGRKVGFRARNYNRKSYVKKIYREVKDSYSSGYLCIGEHADNRHCQSLFERKNPETRYPSVSDTDFRKLEEILDIYRNSKINTKYPETHSGYPDYEKMKKGGVIPVYYQLDNRNNLYMSLAALGRKAFNKTLNQVAGAKAHEKCDDRSNLCPACALFGTTEGQGLGSRVRFTDATCTNFTKDKLKENITFEELSSPKMSYLPFYLREKYDNSRYNWGYDSGALEIRGRKFYWHHVPAIEGSQEIERHKRNATFDVMDTGTEFEFKIYFDGITEEQLSLLVAAVNLHENNMDGKYCHKIGHGKPLGYGSVKMTVADTYTKRTFDMSAGWKEEPQKLSSNKKYLCSENNKDALLKICNFDSLEGDLYKDTVSEYPELEWFSENYKLGNDRPKQSLPEISENQKLEK